MSQFFEFMFQLFVICGLVIAGIMLFERFYNGDDK